MTLCAAAAMHLSAPDLGAQSGCAEFVPRSPFVQLLNDDWYIELTDFGYSDILIDTVPGFIPDDPTSNQLREYLSGEWAAAVHYDEITDHDSGNYPDQDPCRAPHRPTLNRHG